MIFILCPEHYASGGPELLHQLGYKLMQLGFEAMICYMPRDKKNFSDNPCHPNFLHYGVPFSCGDVVDEEENIVIIPDIYAEDITKKIKKAIKVVWWLASPAASKSENELKKMFSELNQDENVIHFSQCTYASQTLLKYGVDSDRIFYLSDYINPIHLEATIPTSYARSNTVLFNPKKGFDFTSRLILSSEGIIKWQATSGLTPSEVHTAMKQGKIYVDFGYHPGMDRIPREAALGGCVVITNKEGAAAYEKDVPIPEQYKFADFDEEKILNFIYEIIAKFDEHQKNFDEYREFIFSQYGNFERDVLALFSGLLGQTINQSSFEELKSNILKYCQEGKYFEAFYEMTVCRCHGYEFDRDLLMAEAEIRTALDENEVAKYIMRRYCK